MTGNGNERNLSDANFEEITDPTGKKTKTDLPQLKIQRPRNSVVLDPGTPILATSINEPARLMKEMELASIGADLTRQNTLT